jgi:pilus assembly protein CpaB
MALRSIFVALLGIAVAGGSAYGAREYLIAQSVKTEDPNAVLTQVIVATQDIPFGVPITPQMLRYQTWPRVALPTGAFTRMEDLSRDSGEPRRAKFAMPAGMPILVSEVSGWGEKVTLVQNLGPNQRAMAIKVDAETAVGGFVTPGDRVDVLLTQGQGEALRTVTILQDIRILGVDQDSNEQQDSPSVAKTVTVEVSPEDSQKLALAQKAGSLSLSLRTLDQVADKPMDYTSLADLLKDKSPVPVNEPKRTVTVRRGNTEVSVVELGN